MIYALPSLSHLVSPSSRRPLRSSFRIWHSQNNNTISVSNIVNPILMSQMLALDVTHLHQQIQWSFLNRWFWSSGVWIRYRLDSQIPFCFVSKNDRAYNKCTTIRFSRILASDARTSSCYGESQRILQSPRVFVSVRFRSLLILVDRSPFLMSIN
jgi:hypothetical protein